MLLYILLYWVYFVQLLMASKVLSFLYKNSHRLFYNDLMFSTSQQFHSIIFDKNKAERGFRLLVWAAKPSETQVVHWGSHPSKY